MYNDNGENMKEVYKYNQKIINIFTILILVLIPLIKLLAKYLKYYNIIQDYESFNPALVLYISLPLLLYTYISNTLIKKSKLDVFDYLYYILIIMSIITTIFSINMKTSILGSIRKEGMISTLAYYTLFVNWKNNKDVNSTKKILKCIFIIGIANVIYSILQIYTNFDFILRFEKDPSMAYGLCLNPNFLGSLIVIILSFLISKYLIDSNKKNLLLIALFIIALVNCQSTIPVLALTLTFVFMSIYLYKINKTTIKKILTLSSTLIIVFIVVQYLNVFMPSIISSSMSSNIFISNNNSCEMCNIKTTINSGGNGRLDIWKKTLNNNVKKYWLTGSGFETFQYVYPNPKAEMYIVTSEEQKSVSRPFFDKAHNVYLNTLADAGIINLIPYLILCLLVFIVGLKLKSEIGIILLSGFIGYSIQAFGNISVIQVAPIYYIIMGMIVSEYKKQQNL